MQNKTFVVVLLETNNNNKKCIHNRFLWKTGFNNNFKVIRALAFYTCI